MEENKQTPLFGKIIFALILLIMSVIILGLQSVNFLAESIEEWLLGPEIQTEEELSVYANDASVILQALDLGRLDPANLGYTYLTEENLRTVLNACVEYQEQQLRTCNVKYTYYHHKKTYAEIVDEKGQTKKVGTDTESTDEQEAVSYTSIEADPEFSVCWQEVYAMCVIASLANNQEWETEVQESAESYTGKQLVPTFRISEEMVDSIIYNSLYSFEYYFDPSAYGDGYVFHYEDMENYAYVLQTEGTNIPHGTEAESDVVDYKEKKIPAIAPMAATNCYKTVVWYYNENGYLEKVRVVCDPQRFIAFANDVTDGNFDFDWFIQLISALPGTDTSVNGAEIAQERFGALYEAYLNGGTIDYERTDISGIGSVKLGANVAKVSPEEYINNFVITLPDDYNYADEEGRLLSISDNLTLEEIQKILDSFTDSSDALNSTASGFFKFQQDYPDISIIGMIAIIKTENGGHSNLTENYWNFFSITCSSSQAAGGVPYHQTSSGHKFINYKSWSATPTAADAVYAGCEFIYKHYVHRSRYHSGSADRDTYYKFQYNPEGTVYCGNAVGDAEGNRWLQNVTANRSRLESVVGRGTAASGGNASVSGSGTGAQIAAYALQFVGNPYVWGGESLTNGADCSGFIKAVYAHFGYALPHSSVGLRSCGTAVPYAEAKAGDIICYDRRNTSGGGNYSNDHCGIYIGNGQIVHAASSKSGIKVSSATYRNIVAVRRIVY